MFMQFKKITTGSTGDGSTVSTDNLSLNPQIPYHCTSCGNPLRLHSTHTAGRYFEHDLEHCSFHTLDMCKYLLPSSHAQPTRPLTPFAQAVQENIQRDDDTLGFPGLQHYFCVMCDCDYYGKKCCLYCGDTHYTVEVSKRDAKMVTLDTAPLGLSSAEQNRYFNHLTLSTQLPVEERGVPHRGVTSDLDRLTEPYLLLHSLLSGMKTIPMNPYTAHSVCQRLISVANDCSEHRSLHPTLQRCAELISQTEEDTRGNEALCISLIQNLRIEYLGDTHQQTLAHWLQKGYQNRLAACRWLAELHTNSPSFAMVGIELAYQQTDTPLACITEDLQHFLRDIHTQDTLTHAMGAVWHLEYGKLKGYFVQVMVFFPVEQSDTGPVLAALLGEYWQQTATQGNGRYYANEAEQGEYRYPGCLSVLPQRGDTLNEVRWVLTAMTEMGFCARLVLPDELSAFGMVRFDSAGAPHQAL
ncbi:MULTISPECIES: putative zinc ribbon protein [unclassified Serratia (in: enterobacteria)]|uniref:putative zinc ribbon protein n=1 Tax=unclassified Serratia (in: enterobacteria) TaxID=2647522 RepID=UPI00046A89E8|nr:MULTISPECIES: putative zinc ribbon protein [unclassified Serratia (in: enterobacteria)]